MSATGPNRERMDAGAVIRRNGAYRITVSDPTGDGTSDELYDCAGSLALAKRILREMIERRGFEGPVRWSHDTPGIWRASAFHLWSPWQTCPSCSSTEGVIDHDEETWTCDACEGVFDIEELLLPGRV